MSIYMNIPCKDPKLQDISGEPVTLLKMQPEWRPKPYNEFTNPPVIKQVWRISVNNNDDIWMIQDYENAGEAAHQLSLIVTTAQFTPIDGVFLEQLGFSWE